MRLSEVEYATLMRSRAVQLEPFLPLPGTKQGNENPLLAEVRRLAKIHGWLCYHTYNSRRSEEGFPDVVLVREAVIFAELKSRTGKPSHAQHIWLRMLERTGTVEVYLWRPQDLPQITARLTRPWRGT